MRTTQQVFEEGNVECLSCGKTGAVHQVRDSGRSERYIAWKLGKYRLTIERWEAATPPSFCVRCWNRFHKTEVPDEPAPVPQE